MSELSVPVSGEMQRWLDRCVAAEGFADAGEYVRQLIQRDQDAYEADLRHVRRLVEEGLESGIVDAEPENILDEIIADIRNGRD